MPQPAQTIVNAAARNSLYPAHSSYLYTMYMNIFIDVYITGFLRAENYTAKGEEQQREVWHKHILACDPCCPSGVFREVIRDYERSVFMGTQTRDNISLDALNATVLCARGLRL